MKIKGPLASKTAKLIYLASLLLLNSAIFRQIGPNASLWWISAVIATTGLLAVTASWIKKSEK